MSEHTKLTDAQLLAIQNVFDMFDADKDGNLTKREIDLAMKKLGRSLTSEQLDRRFAAMDINKNGYIDFTEFVQSTSDIFAQPVHDDEMLKAFRLFDIDKNGKISKQELRTVVRASGVDATDKELDTMLEMADLDGDGQLSYEEFVRLMKK